MHIVHVVGSTDRAGAGVAASVCDLCSALAGVAQVTLVSGASAGARFPVDGRVRQVFYPSRRIPGTRFTLASGLRGVLEKVIDEGADLVHVHGIWSAADHAGCAVARRRGKPYVVSAHGMLMPWAFRHRAWRKKLPWLVYQRANLAHAAAVLGTSEAEADAIRSFKFPCATAMVPHGLNVPPWEAPRNGRSPRQVVFLGRLHPIKGLANLVDAWAVVRRAAPADDWKLVLAGPDEGGFQAELAARIRRCGLEAQVTFPGAVVDERQKWDLYRKADLCILPSFTENFGLVVLESLACGVPVITTRGTPWQVVAAERCGWWVDGSVETLARALQEAMSLTDEQRRAMGENGRRLVADRYDWNRIAGQMGALYEWVLHGGQGPACLR